MNKFIAPAFMTVLLLAGQAAASDQKVVAAFRGRILTFKAAPDAAELDKAGPQNAVTMLKQAVVTAFPMTLDANGYGEATVRFLAFFNRAMTTTNGAIVIDDVTGGVRTTIKTIPLSGLPQGGYEVEGEFSVDSNLCFSDRRYEVRLVEKGATLATGPFTVTGGKLRAKTTKPAAAPAKTSKKKP